MTSKAYLLTTLAKKATSSLVVTQDENKSKTCRDTAGWTAVFIDPDELVDGMSLSTYMVACLLLDGRRKTLVD